jgi:chromosome segregation ATPase
MPSQSIDPQSGEPLSAEERFRKAFERLKSGDPKVLKSGSSISQNNVAKEAGCDPSALKKARFPALIREIQAYIELHPDNQVAANQKTQKKRAANRSIKERLNDTIRQRDQAHSMLASANMRIVELSEEVKSLQQKLDEVFPPPKIHNLI